MSLMKPKALLSWSKAEMKKQKAKIRRRVVPIAAFCFLLSVFISGCGQEAEQARQRAEKELEALRAELDAVKTERGNLQNETARLRKDNEDLLRLRNQVRELRDAQKDAQKQLSQQAQSAQTEIQRAQAQIQAAQAQAAQAQAQAAQAAQAQALALGTNAALALTPEQQAFAARYGLPQLRQQEEAARLGKLQQSACINNLRQLDSAKQQWALENRKTPEAIPTADDIAPYVKTLPRCPGGGTYTLNAVNAHPTCSIPGHALQ